MTPNLWARCAPISAWNTKWERERERWSTFSCINHECSKYLHPRDSIPSPFLSFSRVTKTGRWVVNRMSSRTRAGRFLCSETRRGWSKILKGEERILMREVAAPIFPRLYLARKEQWNDKFRSFRKVNEASTFDSILKKKFPKNFEIRGRIEEDRENNIYRSRGLL